MLVHSKLKKYITNISWLLGEKITSIIMVLVVSPMMARFFGPQQFGMMSAYTSFFLILQSFITTGMDKMTVKQLVEEDETKHPQIYGNVMICLFVGSFIAFGIAMLYLIFQWCRGAGEQEIILGFGIFLGLLVPYSSVANAYFEANIISRYAALNRIEGEILVLLSRILMLLTKSSVVVFGWVTLFIMPIVNQIRLYRKACKRGMLKPNAYQYSWSKAWILRKATLLLSVGALLNLWNRAGSQILLGWFSNYDEVAIYAVAYRFVEFSYFVPIIINSTFFPSLIKSKSQPKQYKYKLLRLFKLQTFCSLLVVCGLCVVGYPIISLLYGPEYMEATVVLMIQAWNCLMIAHTNTKFQVLLASDDMSTFVWWCFSVFIVHLILSVVFISQYGAVGASVASLLSAAVMAFITGLFSRQYRWLLQLQLKAIMRPFPFPLVMK